MSGLAALFAVEDVAPIQIKVRFAPFVCEEPGAAIDVGRHPIMLQTDSAKLSFEEAVKLFKEWGFLVQQGPRTGEVSLIVEAPNYRSYCVCQPEELAEMATAVLRQRLRTGALMTPVLDLRARS